MSSENDVANSLAKSLLMEAWDSKNVEEFCDHFASDAVWNVNTSPPAKGREALEDLTKALMGLSKKSRHFDLKFFSDGTNVTIHGSVEYERDEVDNTVCCFADVFRLDKHGKIKECWTYMDVSPLAPPAES